MLTKEQESFIEYWKENRVKKKKILRNLTLGLPLSLIVIVTIFLNYFSGWYKRADMVKNANPSLFPVLIVASLLIIVFITIFSIRHKWEMNEQYYEELISRDDSEERNT